MKSIEKTEKILIFENLPSGTNPIVRGRDNVNLTLASTSHKPPIKCVHNSQLCIADIDSLAPAQERCLTCSAIDSLDRQLIKLQIQGESINV